MQILKTLLVISVVVISFLFLEKLLFSSSGQNAGFITVGDIAAPWGKKNEVPLGGISVLDFEKQVPEDMTITTAKFYTNAETNKVRLKVWRLIGNAYEAVAKSDLLTLSKGLNVFELDNIKAQKGDYMGIFMESNEIDRSTIHRFKGRVYVIGDNDIIPQDTTNKDALTGYTFLTYGLKTADIENEK